MRLKKTATQTGEKFSSTIAPVKHAIPGSAADPALTSRLTKLHGLYIFF
jgi:hypothetical protein